MLGDDLRKLLFLLLDNEAVPLAENVVDLVDARDETLNQRFFAAQHGAGADGFLNVNENLLVLAVGIVVLFDQHEYVVDVDFQLPDQLDLKDNVVVDIFLFATFTLAFPLVAQVLIAGEVVLQLALGKDFLACELVEGGEQVPHAQDSAEERDKLLLQLFADNERRRERECFSELRDHIDVAGLFLAAFVGETLVVVLEGFQQDNAACVFIAEKGDSAVNALLQVAEANDIAEGFDRIEDAVGARESLNQAVHFEVLVYPERVERRRVEAREEHIDDNQQIQLLVLHAERNVLVIILELLAVRAVVRVEHLIIVLNRAFEEVAGALVERGGVL